MPPPVRPQHRDRDRRRRTIGRAVALRLAAEGAAVLAVDLSEKGLEETIATITEADGTAESCVADVPDESSVRRYAQRGAALAEVGERVGEAGPPTDLQQHFGPDHRAMGGHPPRRRLVSTGAVRASELLRVLQGGGRPTRLGRAIAELGRLAKTLHLLSWIDSEELRRATSVGLTRYEDRHSVARVIFHGNQGELRQPYREGQEDQLGAPGFALNALVVWNAQYMDNAIAYLRTTGHEITDEDLERLSPLQHEHIKMLGNFPFTLPHELAAGQRRLLRGLGDRS